MRPPVRDSPEQVWEVHWFLLKRVAFIECAESEEIREDGKNELGFIPWRKLVWYVVLFAGIGFIFESEDPCWIALDSVP